MKRKLEYSKILVVLLIVLVTGCGESPSPIGSLDGGQLLKYKESTAAIPNGTIKIHKAAVWEFVTLADADKAIKKIGLKENENEGHIDVGNNSKFIVYTKIPEVANDLERCNVYFRNNVNIQDNKGLFQEMDLHLQQAGIGEKLVRNETRIYVIHFKISVTK